MTIARKLSVFGLLFVSLGGVVACGDDDDDSGGSSAAKLASCKQVCDKSATASCVISLPIDVCKQLCDAHAQLSAACQDALKGVSDCQLASADVCTAAGCDAQETAYQQACTK
jgi:hypothetical protein